MRVHEARHEKAPGRVDGFGGVAAFEFPAGPDGDDLAASHRDGARVEDPLSRVHRDDERAEDECVYRLHGTAILAALRPAR